MTLATFLSNIKATLVGNNEHSNDPLLNAAANATRSIEEQVAEHLEGVRAAKQAIAEQTKRQEQVAQAQASFVKAQTDLAKAQTKLQRTLALKESSILKTATVESALELELQRWMANPTVAPAPSPFEEELVEAQPAAPAVETEPTVEAPKPPAPKSPKVTFDGTNLADISEADRQALGLG